MTLMYYHQGSYFNAMLTPMVRLLLAVTCVALPAQFIFDLMTGRGFTLMFGLSWVGLRHLAVWQLVTYMFLHSGFWHLLLNMIGLFFFGAETERALGSRRFVMLYLASGVAAGVGWLLISGAQGLLMGASGAVFGVLAAFAALFPDRPVTLLVFFVLPVTMRARTLAIALAVLTLLMLGSPGNIAHAAHLIGGAAGYLYVVLLFNRRGQPSRFHPLQWWNDWRWHMARRKFKVMSGRPMDGDYAANGSSTEEVDRILEKISRYGLASLTDEENRALREASKRRRF